MFSQKIRISLLLAAGRTGRADAATVRIESSPLAREAARGESPAAIESGDGTIRCGGPSPHSVRSPMKTIKREFRGEKVVLDFHEYERCNFIDCELIYYGFSRPSLVDCIIEGDTTVVLTGPGGNGLTFLQYLKSEHTANMELIVDGILRKANLI